MQTAEVVLKYFPNISETKKNQIKQLYPLYKEQNDKINVISRKDFDNIYIKHVLHSLAIADFIRFKPNTTIIDIGTGGGFPGIPLAIMFPETKFTLIDSIKKKITVTQAVADGLGLENVTTLQKRSNEFKEKFDFVTGRAVTAFPKFYDDVKHLIKKKGINTLPNGILYLKGGEFKEELKGFKNYEIIELNNIFKEDFFETKKLIYLPFY